MRDITIRPALNGYTVQVGCQQLVFTSRDSMLVALNEYLQNPKGVEQRELARAVNPMPGPLEQTTTGGCAIDSVPTPPPVNYRAEAETVPSLRH